tara:strand:- start:111 stop:1154 length:1044 start_codon:yes stop_codon:yes gene_type:complete
MKTLDDDSVDLIFCDLPYGQTSCKWDCPIDLDLFWLEVMRIKKLNTPIFMTTTTKYGVSLINSAPKKCHFRYDIVWVKSSPAGFLSAKKMPMRKHEMVYVFYEKLPFYDLSSHTHKFIKEEKILRTDEGCNGLYGKETGKVMIKDSDGKIRNGEPRYEPPLPVSVVKEESGGATGKELNEYEGEELCKYDVNKNTYGGGKEGRIKVPKDKKFHEAKYDPPLPVSVVKESGGATGKEDYETCKKPHRKTMYGDMEIFEPKRRSEPRYDPPLPTTMLEIKSTRGKHSTEKPVALMEWILKYYSKEGDTILDPTMGSGSTGIACKNMNRNFIGIEKDPEIYEGAVNRIEG